jgi:hypothetical protein
MGGNRAFAVNGLPTDGKALYVKLWYHNGTFWQYRNFIYRANTISGYQMIPESKTHASIAPNEQGHVAAFCPSGTQIVGGGYSTYFSGLNIYRSYPNGNSWWVEWRNTTNETLQGSRDGWVTAYATCVGNH